MMRRLLIVGNWKMNGLLTDKLAEPLADSMRSQSDWPFEMVVCPPFTLLQHVGRIVKGSGIALGAQDCHAMTSGAYTGDISPVMLKDIGCTYAILGHSERRTNHSESDALVMTKANAAIKAGLKVIICIGETETQRKAGQTMAITQSQLKNSVPPNITASHLVLAYEPVWAIGTGRTPNASEIQDVHTFIRQELAALIGRAEADCVRLLYGGSMKPNNAKEIVALQNVDGGLIGGASLKAGDFWAIAQNCT